MKTFLKSKAGKVLTIVTFLVAIVSFFCLRAYYQNQQILNHEVNTAVTTKTNRAALKEDKNIQPPTESDLIKNKKKALQLGVDKYPNGYLIIPSIGVRLPIYNRANNYTLALGVGKDYYLDSQFGKGNVVLAGHDMERPGVLLSNLHRVRVGAQITLTGYNGKEYQYRIISKKIVSPTVKIVDGKPVEGSAFYMPKEGEKPIVTVYTCANGGINRLVVQGELTN